MFSFFSNNKNNNNITHTDSMPNNDILSEIIEIINDEYNIKNDEIIEVKDFNSFTENKKVDIKSQQVKDIEINIEAKNEIRSISEQIVENILKDVLNELREQNIINFNQLDSIKEESDEYEEENVEECNEEYEEENVEECNEEYEKENVEESDEEYDEEYEEENVKESDEEVEEYDEESDEDVEEYDEDVEESDEDVEEYDEESDDDVEECEEDDIEEYEEENLKCIYIININNTPYFYETKLEKAQKIIYSIARKLVVSIDKEYTNYIWKKSKNELKIIRNLDFIIYTYKQELHTITISKVYNCSDIKIKIE